MFHMEHKIDLVSILTTLGEGLFGHDAKVTTSNLKSSFLHELALGCPHRRFSELDVATGQIEIAILDVLAEEDLASSPQDSTRDYFYCFGHFILPRGCVCMLSHHNSIGAIPE